MCLVWQKGKLHDALNILVAVDSREERLRWLFAFNSAAQLHPNVALVGFLAIHSAAIVTVPLRSACQVHIAV